MKEGEVSEGGKVKFVLQLPPLVVTGVCGIVL